MRSRIRAAAIGLLTSLVIACGEGTAPLAEVVRIEVAAAQTPARPRASTQATLWRGERAQEIELGPPRRLAAGGEGWIVREIRADSAAAGRLILGAGAAALVYHLASRVPELADGACEANRLVDYAAGGERALGIWIESPAAASDPFPLSALEGEAGARFIALAQSLGAVDAMAHDRLGRNAAGAPTLPLFHPRRAGDWRALRDRSLASYLPVGLATRLAANPELRVARDRQLVRRAAHLPALANAVERTAGDLEIAGLAAQAAEMAALLRETAAVVVGYFDSVWAELLVRERPPDAADLALYVHNVSAVSLLRLEVTLSHPQLLAESRALSGLRLRAPGDDEAVRVHLGPDAIEFRLSTPLPPRARGPYSFAGTRLDYELTGLAPLAQSRRALLDGLRVVLRNEATDALVPEAHVQRVASLADPRFEIDAAAVTDPARAAMELARVLEPVAADAQPLRWDADAQRYVVARGSYRLRRDFVPPAGTGLLLQAGVEILVEPRVSLLVRGPLVVAGSETEPVRIAAASTEAPWGVFAVQGRGLGDVAPERTRCEIRHLRISGGSQDELRGVFYSGQLSVYHADLALDHVTVSDARADDGLNVKYAQVAIADSEFRDNAADAIDLDWSTGSIRRSSFVRSGAGGDGVDVSGSELAIEDSLFSDIGDKCVSVGEDSRLTVRGSLLRRCQTGIASKDRSQTEVRESILLDNGRHFAAYVKKPIFGAARLAVDDVLIGAAEEDALRDRDSVIETSALRPLAVAGVADLREARTFSRAAYRAVAAAAR